MDKQKEIFLYFVNQWVEPYKSDAINLYNKERAKNVNIKNHADCLQCFWWADSKDIEWGEIYYGTDEDIKKSLTTGNLLINNE